MSEIHEILATKNIGIASAHPDDHLIHGHVIHAGQQVGASFDEFTATLGRNGKNLHADAPDFVQNGLRGFEGSDAALHLGLRSNAHHNGADGNLEHQIARFVPLFGAWALERELDILLTTGDLDDHADHRAAHEIATGAIHWLTAKHNYSIALLSRSILPTATSIAVHPSPESTRRLFEAASLHSSQFQVSDPVGQPDWPVVEGLAIHPDTLLGLDQYSVQGTMYYELIDGDRQEIAVGGQYAILGGNV